MKLTAYSYNYFRDYWNTFDCFIVLFSLASIIIDYGYGGLHISSGNAIRAFRCARIIRMVTQIDSLKIIYKTILVTLPAMLNIGGLLALVIYVYGVIGTNLFCFIRFGRGINREANFQLFQRSLVTLFRLITLEEWFFIFNDTKRYQAPNNPCQTVNSYDDFLELGNYFLVNNTFLMFSRLSKLWYSMVLHFLHLIPISLHFGPVESLYCSYFAGF